MTLTKARIAEMIAAENGMSKNKSIAVVETLIELIKSSLASGSDVLISGFGKFRIQHKNQRRGRNPVTGEEIVLDPRRIVSFKCSGKLRERIDHKD